MYKMNNILDIKEDFAILLGNFDGVHSGHQQIIKEFEDNCSEMGIKSCLITFTPHPKKILVSNLSRFLITDYDDKSDLVLELGVKYYYEIAFTRDFSTLSPKEFLNDYILKNNKLKEINIGYDFAFGANKTGSYDELESLLKGMPIKVNQFKEYKKNGDKTSSSDIRKAILNGNIADANKLLGRNYSLAGVVVKGEGRGRKIGFPTANISIHSDLIYPAHGVYISQTETNGMTYNSVTNIGLNPTFERANPLNIETNIFDFNDNIYGEKIRVTLLKRIRDEVKFNSVNELINQIDDDVKTSKDYFNG
jgi:riboflavin kinase/FMN adenylyltransferase